MFAGAARRDGRVLRPAPGLVVPRVAAGPRLGPAVALGLKLRDSLNAPVLSTWPFTRDAVKVPMGRTSRFTVLPVATMSAAARAMANMASPTIVLSSVGTQEAATATADSFAVGTLAAHAMGTPGGNVRDYPGMPWVVATATQQGEGEAYLERQGVRHRGRMHVCRTPGSFGTPHCPCGPG